MELTISFSTILMACLGFLGVYILMPIALTFRDYLVVYCISRFIYNAEFYDDLKKSFKCKAELMTIYNKYGFVTEDEPLRCFIDGVEVSEKKYQRYGFKKLMRETAIESVENKLRIKLNFIHWIEKYFKLDSSFAKAICEMTEKIYDTRVKEIIANGEDIIISDMTNPQEKKGAGKDV